VTTGEALCVGLISGTSVDGIDAALVRITGHAQDAAIELIAFDTYPYPDDIRAELLALYEDQANAIARLSSLNVVIGRLFAQATLDICAVASVDSRNLEVVGSHGQTVWHQPRHDPAISYSTISTIQIGAPSEIAERTGAPVIADFRLGDMAVGGQGAPLAPYFDWAVHSDPVRNRAIQNIGGIGNVTWLPAGGAIDDVIAFDTGPGNMLIDGVIRELSGGELAFDRDGALAAEGEVDPGMLGHLLEDPYLNEAPPKSTGREYYDAGQVREMLANMALEPGALGSADAETQRRCRIVIATATAFTARSIADAYRRFLPALPDDVLVNGGGARNPVLMRMIAEALPGATVESSDGHGVNADAKEAMLFALMAHDALAGYPTNIPAATGARRAVRLGSLTRL
jgi:anhydro-N-acetylmuramic acid kinase